MRKREGEVVRPARVAREENGLHTALFQLSLQQCQRADGQFVALRQPRDEAVAAIGAKPYRVARKKILVIDQIHHVAPGVPGHEEALHPDAVDVQHLPVAEQHFLIVYRHLRQFVEVIAHLAGHLARQVAVLLLADVERRIPEQPRAVGLHRAHMVGVLMGDEDVVDVGGF